jgi:anaerobic magnesium-protoporphyrin IX monomethyl ester cyclase
MIILFNPQSAPPGKTYLPLSLLSLGAVLEGNHEYAIVDGNLDSDPATTIIELAKKTGATVLGVTVMPGPQLKQAVQVCPKVRQALPNLKIVWGGYFPTEHPDVCIKADYIDYVVKGQGEFTFLELLGLLGNGGDPAAINGLVWLDKRGQVRLNRERKITSPQHLPAYPYHRVPMDKYAIQTAIGERTLPHNSSFGCPYWCNFCAVVQMVEGKWLAEKGERTAHTVRFLHEEYKADAIIFVDNNFFAAEKRVRQYAQALLDQGTKVRWWGEGRVDTLLKYSPDTWELMRKAGCYMIFMGAESGSDETLAMMNKGGTVSADATLELTKVMGKYGVIPEYSFIMGCPPNPDKDIANTIRFIKKIKEINPATEIIQYLYSPEPVEGELLDAATAGGFNFPQTLEEWVGDAWGDFAHRHNPHTPWLKPKHRQKVNNFGKVLNARYPTTTDTKLQGWRGHIVKTIASWRYELDFYHCPYELTVLDKVLNYQRQDTRAR